jgi:HK97 family phage major capsid protein
MGHDAMLADLQSRIEKETSFQEKLVSDAQAAGRDLTDSDTELYDRSLGELKRLQPQLDRVLEARRIGEESTTKFAEVHASLERSRTMPAPVEYRTAGAFVTDYMQAMLGDAPARQRYELFQRAAAHQTTADNAGLIPAPILAPVVSFIDANRTLVSQLGPRQLPGQTWSRPKVTQHTTVAVQSAEKAELSSQKMLITKLTGTAATYGGYVNVSRQDIDFTQPGIMDIVINDLAAVYAVQTEAAACAAFDTASTAGVPIATGAATAAGVATSLWDAAGKIYTATKGAGRVFAVMGPDMLPILGPVFPPYNPQNAISPGLTIGDFGSGAVGSISGIPLFVSGGVGTLRMLVFSTAAAEVYEDRIGALQVVEPSVLGVQVAYAGYFTPMVIEGTAIIKIVKTP